MTTQEAPERLGRLAEATMSTKHKGVEFQVGLLALFEVEGILRIFPSFDRRREAHADVRLCIHKRYIDCYISAVLTGTIQNEVHAIAALKRTHTAQRARARRVELPPVIRSRCATERPVCLAQNINHGIVPTVPELAFRANRGVNGSTGERATRVAVIPPLTTQQAQISGKNKPRK